MTGQEPPIRLDNSELSNMEMNKVAAATFLVNGGKNIAAVDVDMSGEGGSWPILLPAQTVVVKDDRRTKIGHFGLACGEKNNKMLEKNAESWTIW
jgi:hypothetical protein